MMIETGAYAHEARNKFRPVGSAQIDYGSINQMESANKMDDFALRRLRLGTVGWLGDGFRVKAVADVDEDLNITFTDAYLQWRTTYRGTSVVIGQHRTPNSLDEQTSSRRLSTLERAAFTDAFGFGRRIGISMKRGGEGSFITVGAFARDIDGGDDQAGHAIAARGVYHPKVTDKIQLHVGGSMRFRRLDEDAPLFQYEQQAYARMSRTVMSASAAGRSDVFFGAEAGVIADRFWIAAEAGVLAVRTDGADPDGDRSHFHGGYAEIGTVFGGRRLYSAGRFGNVDVDRSILDGGRGALSLVLRYDSLYLGGRYAAFVAGANWRPANGVMLSANLFATRTSQSQHTGYLELQRDRGVLLRAQYGF